MNKKKAELIFVGTELLLGDILNTDAQYLSKELARIGIDLYYQSVVGDNFDRLTSVLNLAYNRSDIIIITGGLGPTGDDITRETVATYLNEKLVLNKDLEEDIYEKLKNRLCTIPKNNMKQALVPQNGYYLDNKNGTAPGLVFKKNDKLIILLPGPLVELKYIFEKHLINILSKYSDTKLFSSTFKIVGIGESNLEELLCEYFKSEDPTLSPYAKTAEVHLRMTTRAGSKIEAEEKMEGMRKCLYKLLGNKIYTEDDICFEEYIKNLLIDKKLTLATAESLTGGLLSSSIIDISGASKVFKGGVTAYSNEEKEKFLGISKDILDKDGAISSITAELMAENVAKLMNTDIGISTTGNAGPELDENKPCGLVYISVFYKKSHTRCLHLTGDRNLIREKCVKHALLLLRKVILEEE